MDLSILPTLVTLDSEAVAPGGAFSGSIRSATTTPIATTATIRVAQLSLLAVCRLVSGSTFASLSRLRPSGVSSKAQANTRAGTKPSASKMMMPRTKMSGTSNTGNTVSATCTTTQAETR